MRCPHCEHDLPLGSLVRRAPAERPRRDQLARPRTLCPVCDAELAVHPPQGRVMALAAALVLPSLAVGWLAGRFLEITSVLWGTLVAAVLYPWIRRGTRVELRAPGKAQPNDDGRVIPARPARAALLWAPLGLVGGAWLAVGVPILLLPEHGQPLSCIQLFGANGSLFALAWLVHLTPATMLLGSVYAAAIGVEALRTGLFPPRALTWFTRLVATPGRRARLQGLALLLTGVFLTGLVVHTFDDVRSIFPAGTSLAELNAGIDADCEAVTRWP